MAPAVGILPIPTADPQVALNEKAPALVEIPPVARDSVQVEDSPSSGSIGIASGLKFELEDHPIDAGRKLRVCIPIWPHLATVC
jgi:hypothetical protein